MGSAMEIAPAGDYRHHLPTGSAEERIGSYWKATGRYLEFAVEEHGKEQQPVE